MAGWNKQSDALTFPQILLSHYQNINKISIREFKVTERILVVDGSKVIQESEDVSKIYCQAVLQLSYILTPYFDDGIREQTKIHLPILEGFGFEIIEKIDNKELKKRIKEATGKDKDDLVVMFQVSHARKLFVALGLLLRRVEYLKTNVFGDTTETDDNVIDDEEDAK